MTDAALKPDHIDQTIDRDTACISMTTLHSWAPILTD